MGGVTGEGVLVLGLSPTRDLVGAGHAGVVGDGLAQVRTWAVTVTRAVFLFCTAGHPKYPRAGGGLAAAMRGNEYRVRSTQYAVVSRETLATGY